VEGLGQVLEAGGQWSVLLDKGLALGRAGRRVALSTAAAWSQLGGEVECGWCRCPLDWSAGVRAAGGVNVRQVGDRFVVGCPAHVSLLATLAHVCPSFFDARTATGHTATSAWICTVAVNPSTSPGGDDGEVPPLVPCPIFAGPVLPPVVDRAASLVEWVDRALPPEDARLLVSAWIAANPLRGGR
jgi:hypothetical protein